MRIRTMFAVIGLLVLCASPAAAAPRWLTAVPRAFGRTAKNLVTWKDPKGAIEELVVLGAVAADAYTTADAQARCPLCQETAPILGARPGNVRLSLTMLGVGFAEAAWVQYGNELMNDGGSKWWDLAPAGAAAGFAMIHATAAADNASIK